MYSVPDFWCPTNDQNYSMMQLCKGQTSVIIRPPDNQYPTMWRFYTDIESNDE